MDDLDIYKNFDLNKMLDEIVERRIAAYHLDEIAIIEIRLCLIEAFQRGYKVAFADAKKAVKESLA